MSIRNLSYEVKTTMVVAPTSKSSTGWKKVEISKCVDMAGFEGVTFKASFGAIGAAKKVGLYVQGATSTGGTYRKLAGSSVSSTANAGAGFVETTVVKPALGDPDRHYRYLRPYMLGTSTGVFGGCLAEQWGARSEPVGASSNIRNSSGAAVSVVSPGSTT